MEARATGTVQRASGNCRRLVDGATLQETKQTVGGCHAARYYGAVLAPDPIDEGAPGVLRPTRRRERWCEAVWITLGLIYSLGFYAVCGLALMAGDRCAAYSLTVH
jgi:hypothetical protein